MDKNMNQYLERVNRYLKPLPISERADIIKEVKSEMAELESVNGLSSAQILAQLGNPKALAKAYLGESIAKSSAFSWKKWGAIAAFYSLAGVSGVIVLPVLSVLSVTFMLIGPLTLIAGIIQCIGYLLGFTIPFVVMQLGSYTPHPLLQLPLSTAAGLLLFLAGVGLWKLMIQYIQVLNKNRKCLHR